MEREQQREKEFEREKQLTAKPAKGPEKLDVCICPSPIHVLDLR